MEHRPTRFTIHRGLEPNQKTPNSFEGIVRSGIHGLECDVFLLRDGGLGVVHNADVRHSQEEIEAMETAEFHQLHTRERGTDIERGAAPTLDELLFQSHDRGARLMIELKASSPEKAEALARAMVKRMRLLIEQGAFMQSGDRGKAYVEKFVGMHSFSIEALFATMREMHGGDLNIPLGLFWASTFDRAKEMSISATAQSAAVQSGGRLEALQTQPEAWALQGLVLAQRLHLQSFNPHESLVTPQLVQRAHQHGIEVAPWVVNNPTRIRELTEIGVDNIITEAVPV